MGTTALARGTSKALLVAGGIIFFFGDRALREIWKVNFVLAEVCGIGGGLLLMVPGGAFRSAASRAGSADKEPARLPSDE
jgi:hypothetical protein